RRGQEECSGFVLRAGDEGGASGGVGRARRHSDGVPFAEPSPPGFACGSATLPGAGRERGRRAGYNFNVGARVGAVLGVCGEAGGLLLFLFWGPGLWRHRGLRGGGGGFVGRGRGGAWPRPRGRARRYSDRGWEAVLAGGEAGGARGELAGGVGVSVSTLNWQ